MALLEFLSAIASAAVTALVSGIVKLFAGRKGKDETHIHLTSKPQTIIVVGNEALGEFKFPDTPRTREILEIPHRTSQLLPQLLLPGEGLVSRGKFLDRAMDSLITRSNERVRCEGCNQFRYWGALTSKGWRCTDCLHPHLVKVIDGKSSVMNSSSFASNPWRQVEPLFLQSSGYEEISDDPTMRALIAETPPTGPSGEFLEFWIEHDLRDDYDNEAMKLHLSLVVRGGLDTAVRVHAFFCLASGERLRDLDGVYCTKSGHVAIGTPWFALGQHDARFEGDLMMPYDQLHLGAGDHQLKCHAGVLSREYGRYLFWSEWISFPLER